MLPKSTNSIQLCRPAAVWPVPRQRAARPRCCECPCSGGAGATWEMENQTEERSPKQQEPTDRTTVCHSRLPPTFPLFLCLLALSLCDYVSIQASRHPAKLTKGLQVSMIGGRAERTEPGI